MSSNVLKVTFITKLWICLACFTTSKYTPPSAIMMSNSTKSAVLLEIYPGENMEITFFVDMGLVIRFLGAWLK